MNSSSFCRIHAMSTVDQPTTGARQRSAARRVAWFREVCDNTMGEALRGAGQVIKIRHKKNSRQGRLEVLSARQALDMVQILADDFAAEVRDLCQITVSEAQWQDFLLAHAPDTGTQRSRTFASNRRT